MSNGRIQQAIRHYGALRDELRQLEARDALDAIERIRAHDDEIAGQQYEARLRRVWMMSPEQERVSKGLNGFGMVTR